MVIFVLKVVIFNFKMATQFSENIFIWMVAINWISNHGLIHFTISFFTFLSLLYQKGRKMSILGLKMTILDFKMAMDLFENIFIWTAMKSCVSHSSFIRFGAV